MVVRNSSATGNSMFLRIPLVLALLLLAGCVVQPKPLQPIEIAERVDADLSRLSTLDVPVTGPISIYDAMARALSYNLDVSLERHKLRLVEAELSVSRYDQLPQLVAEHLADGRNNFAGGVSQSLLTGRESLEPSTSSERYIKRNDLSLSWDILDFGVSYFRARQAGDNVLLIEEQQKKVIHRILDDVQQVYWRALSYQQHVIKVQDLMARTQTRLADSKQMQVEGITPPLAALSYRRELLQASRDLYQLHGELSQAKAELAFLMNLPAGTRFELVDHQKSPRASQLGTKLNLANLERHALENRSELREISYQERINSAEIKAASLELMPGISLDYGRTRDGNNFLFNTNWTDYGARVSWNLLNVFRIGDTRDIADAKSEILRAQRLALSAAILTQLHVGLAQFQHSAILFHMADQLLETQAGILDQVERAVEADSSSEQALIREEVNALLERVRYDIAYAELRKARSDVYSALGMTPSLDELDDSNLENLSRSLQAYYTSRAAQTAWLGG